MSITVAAQVLGDITLLLASCQEISLSDVNDSHQRGLEMDTHPVRLDALSGDPRVVIRVNGIDQPAALSLQVRLEATALTGEFSVALLHNFGGITLTAQAPVANLRLPLRRLHANSGGW
ncbi:hypothetical protein [Mycobacterium simiae]|uniref:hypothetical protein n=1 Tax=Mycobacterium simiae TaxID=1784 RepID=UPI001E390F58|nr:hypothetical protein [Mycobacterium simiae]